MAKQAPPASQVQLVLVGEPGPIGEELKKYETVK